MTSPTSRFSPARKSSASLLGTLPTPLRAVLPGFVLVLVVWFVTYIRLDFPNWVENQYWLWQILGRSNLAEQPFDSLLVLHTQPPGLNALLAVDLAISPGSHGALALMFLLMLMIALFGTVDTLVASGSSTSQATVAGMLFAILPTPVVYSLWPFSTLPTMTGAVMAIWGVARLKTHPVLGVALSAVGVFTLLLFRSGFVWLFVMLWLVALALLCFRTASSRSVLARQCAILIAVLMLTGLIQGRHVQSFGNLTLSSWGGQNVLNALVRSGSLTIDPALEQDLRGDPCTSAIVDLLLEGKSLFGTDARDSPSCQDVPAMESRGTPAWDEPLKDGGERNYNWSRDLALSRVYTDVAVSVVRDNPLQLLRVAFASEGGRDSSGLQIYLGPSENYSFVEPVRQHHPLATPGGVLSLFFAPVMITLGCVGLIRALRNRRNYLPLLPLYAATSVLLGYHILVSTMLEYGENMRFQAEMFPVLIVFGITGLRVALGMPTSRQPDPTTPADAAANVHRPTSPPVTVRS